MLTELKSRNPVDDRAAEAYRTVNEQQASRPTQQLCDSMCKKHCKTHFQHHCAALALLCACLLVPQAAQNLTIQLPTNSTSNFITNVVITSISSNSTKIADVLLTDSYYSYTPTQRAAIVNFVQQGAGLVLGGQAWWVPTCVHGCFVCCVLKPWLLVLEKPFCSI